MDSMYLENLDEYIYDEKKVVTYKWLSITLNVSANIAKQMLYHFVEKNRESKEKQSLAITYFVSGVVEGKNDEPDTLKMMVVNEENLPKVKNSMKEVVSVHIYSIQCTELKDLSILYTVDYDIVKNNLFNSTKLSGIKCDSAKEKSDKDIERLKQSSAYVPPPEQEKIATKGTIKGPSNQNLNQAAAKSNKPTGIASMFSNQAKKSESKPVIKSEPKDEKPKKSPEKKKSGGISAFLTKGPPAKKIKTEKDEESSNSPSIKSESSDSPVVKSEPSESPVKEEKMEVMKSPTDKPKTYSRKNKSTESKTFGKVTEVKSKKSTANNNKRKRIMQLSDSESSDNNSEPEEDDESPLPPTPPPPSLPDSDDEIIQGTPQPDSKVDVMSKSGGKSRKMKTVLKTYTDEEGFLLTKKEFVYVSGSEEEEEEEKPEDKKPVKVEKKSPSSPSKNSKPSNNKKSKSSPTKSTQSSIMSFFKKK